MLSTDRKLSYKLPPTTIRDKLVSQETRRNKALEEQRRRRAQKVDSSRQLDLFADLSLAEHSDEDVHEEVTIEDDEAPVDPRLAAASVAAYASLLQAGNDTIEMVPETSRFVHVEPHIHEPPISTHPTNLPAQFESKKSRKRGGKNSHKRRTEANKASNGNKYKAGSSRWADKCMYAELLEMRGDQIWDANGYEDQGFIDGLPSDLEHGWVAVAPVPKGKRCLVVTHRSAGVAGVVPNTTLRSRLLGKSLLSRFPSPLPPLTVLDCILDDHWRENGILHVLDVVRWKGQDVDDCEARFRFWWRDTRLAELVQTPPPTFQFIAGPSASPTTSTTLPHSNSQTQSRYSFPYPTTFIPVPYYSSTSLAELDMQIIPAARSVRTASITLPALTPSFAPKAATNTPADVGRMEIEPIFQTPNMTPPTASTAIVQPDGMLLYVAEASYEPGTSPLSSWIPIQGYNEHSHDGEIPVAQSGHPSNPLDLFQRLVQKRLARVPGSTVFAGVSTGLGTIDDSYKINTTGDATMEL